MADENKKLTKDSTGGGRQFIGNFQDSAQGGNRLSEDLSNQPTKKDKKTQQTKKDKKTK